MAQVRIAAGPKDTRRNRAGPGPYADRRGVIVRFGSLMMGSAKAARKVATGLSPAGFDSRELAHLQSI